MEEEREEPLVKTHKKELISGAITIVVSLISAIISMKSGIAEGQKNTIKEVSNFVANVNGDYNTVTVNNVDELVELYLELQEEIAILQEKNNAYFLELSELKEEQKVYGESNQRLEECEAKLEKSEEDLKNSKSELQKLVEELNEREGEIASLKSKVEEYPTIDYANVGLCIYGEDVAINTQESMVVLDGREYYSKQIIENLLDKNESFDIKDGVAFVGKKCCW